MSQPDELMIQTMQLADLKTDQTGVLYSSDLLRKIGEKIEPFELCLRPVFVDEKYEEVNLHMFKKSVVIRTDLGYVLQKFPEYYNAFLKKNGKEAVTLQVNFKRCGINICDKTGSVITRIGFASEVIYPK